MTTKKPLKLKISIELGVKIDHYNERSVVDSKKEIQLVLDSDSPKRKIIDFVEGEAEQLLSEMSRAVHHSDLLTDGEVGRKEEETKV